ncbi:cytidine deaminase [Breoghania corrubedonensis]|uniref:Cytidine deaminase n=1 Tax=Breoghania corrubedonensis TaxID=665038 RepID=A0A2T5VFG1_9HYPH|nr:cytidine deaminase [Breoghania corrubedonensis]PTW62505.1 cytidine deaminase [Breoghania corrubedonensis]
MSSFDALFAAAKAARENAHSPYSGYKVGAAVKTRDGTIHAGCNIENASYPEGWCAETTALGCMAVSGAREVVEVVVVADGERLCTPCGGCRQRLAEFAGPETPVHIAGLGGLRQTFTLGELLPAGFALEDKDKTEGATS